MEHPFLKEHDAEFLEVNFLAEDSVTLIKMNFCYSISYQVPVFLFMVYDNNQPFSAD